LAVVSWLIVVGGLVLLALGIHFAEQRKSKAIMLARRTEREARPAELYQFSFSLEVEEKWDVDLQEMMLRLTRSDESSVRSFRLERSDEGTWQMRPIASAAERSVPVPASVAEKLEQRYRRYSRDASSKASG
jgi:hypothetical protein